jgi:alanine racemase
MPHLHLDSVRAGIITYGVCPPGEFNRDIGVRECFTLASEVIDIHRIPAGRGVSYTHSYKAEQPTTIITMPCGYADGMPRSLSNKVDILLGGRRYPQAGNITMDYVMADVGDAPVSIGDEVVFIGRQGAEEIRLSDIARQAGVLPYQVSCGWGPRVRRVYLEE